jgi:D-alanyl-D-alanine carboxypeptidase (penicillin-binding protein 5/6)
VVGTINVQLGEELVASRQLVTMSTVEEAGFFGSTWDSLKLWMNGFFEDDEEE